MLPSPSGASRVKRGPGPKYPRPADCPHLDRPEHSRGACYPCTSHRLRREKLAKKQQATSGTQIEKQTIFSATSNWETVPEQTHTKLEGDFRTVRPTRQLGY
jgi:hypothetical protein